jgi:hypothetical protein
MLKNIALAAVLGLAACAAQDSAPVGGPGSSPFDGRYSGQIWVIGGPPFCGSATGNPIGMTVRGGEAFIPLTSNGLRGPVGPDGDLSALRFTGRAALQSFSVDGRIGADGRFNVIYQQDLCRYQIEGRRQ